MWKIIQELLILSVFVLVISQIIMPVFLNKMKFFWIFSKQGRADVFQPPQKPESLQEKISAVRPEVQEVKDKVRHIQSEATEEFKKAREAKKETDNLI